MFHYVTYYGYCQEWSSVSVWLVVKVFDQNAACKKNQKTFKKTVDKKKVIWYYKRVGTREPKTTGSIAQLVEHMPYKHGVTGSSPVVPTTSFLVSTRNYVAR